LPLKLTAGTLLLFNKQIFTVKNVRRAGPRLFLYMYYFSMLTT
jgi:hypothetical protein